MTYYVSYNAYLSNKNYTVKHTINLETGKADVKQFNKMDQQTDNR